MTWVLLRKASISPSVYRRGKYEKLYSRSRLTLPYQGRCPCVASPTTASFTTRSAAFACSTAFEERQKDLRKLQRKAETTRKTGPEIAGRGFIGVKLRQKLGLPKKNNEGIDVETDGTASKSRGFSKNLGKGALHSATKTTPKDIANSAKVVKLATVNLRSTPKNSSNVTRTGKLVPKTKSNDHRKTLKTGFKPKTVAGSPRSIPEPTIRAESSLGRPPIIISRSTVTSLRPYQNYQSIVLELQKWSFFPRGTLFVVYGPKKEAAPDERPVNRPFISGGLGAMSCWADVISTPTADTPGGCLYLHLDKRRYLFGRLGEGTQRAMTQRKYAMSTMSQVFVSGEVNWATVGGMMGLLITISDVVNTTKLALKQTNQEREQKGQKKLTKNDGMDHLHIHGAENLTYTLATARHFIFRTGMPFQTHEPSLDDPRLTSPETATDEPDWQDDSLLVWKVPLRKEASRKRRSNGELVTAKTAEDEGSPGSSSDGSSDGQSGEKSQKETRAGKKETRNILSALVESMFNSDWKMDALIPMKLRDVQLPAKLFVRDPESHQIKPYAGPLPKGSSSLDSDSQWDQEVLVREPWPATKVVELPQVQPSSQSLCYIVKHHPRRGKFNPSVALKHGVAPVDFRKLTMGESVMGSDGVLVTPEMVLGAPVYGAGFVMADIPDVSYLASFLARPEWANAKIMQNVKVFYWNLGEDLLQNPDLQSFLRDHQTYKHVVMSPDACCNMLTFESHASVLTKLQRIDAKRFPTLDFNNQDPVTFDSSVEGLFERARIGKRIQLLPQLSVKDDQIVPFPDITADVRTMDKKVLEIADEAAARVQSAEFQAQVEASEADLPHRDMEIIPLGTGSALPSKYRNVSSTLLRIPGVGNYLLDCGENTLGQIRRCFGEEETQAILRDLRLVFISHMHADHHLGTASILDAWNRATLAVRDSPASTNGNHGMLVVSCSSFMRRYLEEYARVQPSIGLGRIRFVGANVVDSGHDYVFVDPVERAASGLASISRVRVDHCRGAHAGVLTWPSGLRVCFSGDCRPSRAFAAKGLDATLLIHEATFDDDKAGDAVAKKHSTMAEALDVARQMRARRVLLTHFSQRYAKISSGRPASPEPVDKTDNRASDDLETKSGNKADGADAREKDPEAWANRDRVVLPAFDQMRVRLGEFQHAAEFLPAIRLLLEEETEVDA